MFHSPQTAARTPASPSPGRAHSPAPDHRRQRRLAEARRVDLVFHKMRLDFQRAWGETPRQPSLPAARNVWQAWEKHGPDYVREHTELFPDVANCRDSLGEAWLAKGDKKKALECYRKALNMNPNLPSAREMVEKLGG